MVGVGINAFGETLDHIEVIIIYGRYEQLKNKLKHDGIHGQEVGQAMRP